MKKTTPLSPAGQYDRDGFLIIHDLLSPEECEKLKIEARRVLDEHCPDKRSVYVHVAVVSELYRALAEDKRVVKMLKPVMPHGIMFMSDKIVYKSAEKASPTPPHVDFYYWPNTRPKLSVWIPLDDTTAENGTLTVVPGSHKRDWKMVRHAPDKGEFHNSIDDGDWKDGDMVTCEIKRGSAIIFSDRLVHASTENTAGKDRYVIINTYHAPAADEAFDLDFPARKVILPAAS